MSRPVPGSPLLVGREAPVLIFTALNGAAFEIESAEAGTTVSFAVCIANEVGTLSREQARMVATFLLAVAK